MEITGWDIYWITRLDTFKDVSAILSIILGISCFAVGLFFLVFFDLDYSSFKFKKRYFFIPLTSFLFCLVGGAALPTTKEMCAIIVIPKIVNNEEVQGLGEEIVTLARDWIKELKPNEIK